MILAFLAAVALADDGGAAGRCDVREPLDRDTLSIAWVAPSRKRVGAGAWLTVVPTRDLRALIEAERADTGRTLAALGLHKSGRPVRGRWSVTVFEVDADTLCRPLDDAIAGEVVDGHPVCPRGDRGTQGDLDGCGYSEDTRTGQRGLDLFSIRWRDAATQGFCVLPLDRFIRGR